MPNLLMISIDDLFSINAWPEFAALVQTPNLDAFAAQSTNFTAAYTGVALCNPSRSAVLSGHEALETGIIFNTGNVFDAVPADDIIFQRLANAGMSVAMGGKVFHAMRDPRMESFVTEFLKDDGVRAGFFDNLGLPSVGGINYGNSEGIVLGDDTLVNSVLNYLSQPHDGPFALAAGLFRPHADWVVPQQFFDLYDPATIEVPYFGDDAQGEADFYYALTGSAFHKEALSEDAWVDLIHAYLASVSYTDYLFGQMMDALAASPYAADTNVVLWSDHGYHLGDRGIWHKFTLWEESGRAPLMIHLAGQTEGQVVDTVVSLQDIYPTLLEMFGITDGFQGSGHSLMPFLTGTGTYEGNGAFTWMYGGYSLRSGDFRYIREEDGTELLFNIAQDPHQNHNLVTDPAYAAVLGAMQAQLPEIPGRDLHLGSAADDVIAGTAAKDIFIGGGGQDVLTGGNGDDTYFVYAGAVVVENAGGGRDTVISDAVDFVAPDNVEVLVGRAKGISTITGNDLNNVITSNEGGTTIYARGGNDKVQTMRGNDFIDGGDGNDDIFASRGNDEVHGGAGYDRILGDFGADVLYGEAGHDTINAGNDDDFADGGAGDDDINGGLGADTLRGGLGNDTIVGGTGADKIYGDAGLDILDGGIGADLLYGGAGQDLLFGSVDNDTLWGETGDDFLDGGNGNDVLWGGIGNDTLSGGAGDDVLNGMFGNDDLKGGAGNDRLSGGTDNDVIHLDFGQESVSGGTGADIFVLDLTSQRDIIFDFEVGVDRIDLSIRKYADFDTLLNRCTQGVGYVFIDFGGGHGLRLNNVLLEQLSADDFILAAPAPASALAASPDGWLL